MEPGSLCTGPTPWVSFRRCWFHLLMTPVNPWPFVTPETSTLSPAANTSALQLRADRERLRVRHAHFFEHFVRLHARLLELPELGLREGFLVRFDETEFKRGISVVCHRLDLHYGAGAGFHYRDGNHGSVRRKELGHSDFASDDCFIHR